MTQGGANRDPWSAPRWLRLEGLLATALRVRWQHEPPIVAGRADDAQESLEGLCSALSASNAFAFAWQALGLALIEPELRIELADTDLIDALDPPELRNGRTDKDLLDKLDVVLAVAPSVSAVFDRRLRWGALHDLRSMLDSAVILPPVYPESLPQWWSKSTVGLVARAAEHLALQLDVVGMPDLASVLRAPVSPAFAFLAAYMAQNIRRVAGPSRTAMSTEAPPLEPSLLDRWVSELYVAARIVGRFRSDTVARSMSQGATADGVFDAPPVPHFGGATAPEGPTSEPPTEPRPALRKTPPLPEPAASPRPSPPDAAAPLRPEEKHRPRFDAIRAFLLGIVAVSVLTVCVVGYRLGIVSSDEVSSPTLPGPTAIAPPAELATAAPPVTDDLAAQDQPCARAVTLAAEGDFVQANHVFTGCNVERFEAGADISRYAQKAVEDHLAKGDCHAAQAVIDAVGDVGVMLGPADERKLVNCRRLPSPAAPRETPLYDPR